MDAFTVNVRGKLDTVYVVFSGDRIETLKAVSFAARRVARRLNPLEAETSKQLARQVPANNTKPKISMQTDDRRIGRAAFWDINLICLSLGALDEFRSFLCATGPK
jgi:hypothetical protein